MIGNGAFDLRQRVGRARTFAWVGPSSVFGFAGFTVGNSLALNLLRGAAGAPVAWHAMFQGLPGTNDLLPPATERWRALVALFADHCGRSGFGEVIPPMFEELGVFLRIGASTDVVTKEMYDFMDKGGRHIALRPEFTAALMRVFIEKRPARLPWKVWSWGPVFRYEKPQAGRYRQFFQLDAEVVGSADPDIDVEIIALADRFFRGLGLQQFTLRLNSLGDGTTRPQYLDALRDYFNAHLGELSDQSRATLLVNPLRVLDSKREPDQAIIEAAPKMRDFLSEDAGAHFARVQEGLTAVGVPFTIDDRLVRGLDYYTHTCFEFASDALDSAQNAIGGGGHYDNLVEALDGPSTPGIGFGLGIDRILLACDAEGVFAAPETMVDVFVVDTTGGLEALRLCAELRSAGVRADRSFDGKSMKAQMKAADKSGAAVAVLIGTDEVAAGEVTLRHLRGEGAQERVARASVVERFGSLV